MTTLTHRESLALSAMESIERPTQAEVAVRFGVTQSAIAQRVANARTKIYGTGHVNRARRKVKVISLSLCSNY